MSSFLELYLKAFLQTSSAFGLGKNVFNFKLWPTTSHLLTNYSIINLLLYYIGQL